MANTEIVENDAARTRGGATIEIEREERRRERADRRRQDEVHRDGDPEVGRVGQRDEDEPVDHPDDGDEPQEEAGVASWRSWRCGAWRRTRR